MNEYEKFLESKVNSIQESGFEVDENQLNTNLFDFQKYIVKTALKKGKYAIFANCGLGKTIIQLEWANQVVNYTNKSVLILCPLAVAGQTIQEGKKFNIKIEKYNNQSDIGIYIINYEQLDNIENISKFSGVVLDESSILKNFTAKNKTKIIDLFANTNYKLACTATPSPNDVMELGNHAEFLNIMSRNEMLSMYFIHDAGNTQKWRLKKHSNSIFWDWVSTWAIMLNLPSDIGFSNNGFILPKLNLIETKINTDKRDNGQLFNTVVINATNFNAELRITKLDRLEKAADIINNNPEDSFIIWIKQNEEEKIVKNLIPHAVIVSGSDKNEVKENRLLGFAKNEFQILVTKSKIAQFGLNYQNCHNQIFASMDFSFESLYQSIRRSYRFGQKNIVNIYLISTDTMDNVIQSINRKKEDFEKMQKQMALSSNKNVKGNVNIISDTKKRLTKECSDYKLINGDCVQESKNIESNSIGFSIFSPPFAELYTYSDKLEDMGNSKNYEEFFEHFNYLIPELYRIMESGRLVALHCMDLPIQKGKEGYIGLRDFSGMLIKEFQDNGFIYHSRVTIWKDPVVEMQRTKALGLLHKQIKKDSSMSRVGIPDYLLVFRKDGDNLNPIQNTDMPVDLWQEYASPVWMNINQSNTLQFRNARENNDEKHICPLQLDVIERSIRLWSNPRDIVFSPFAGIGSEGYQSLKMGRRFTGIELKGSYFDSACKNLDSAIQENKQSSIFDLLEV